MTEKILYEFEQLSEDLPRPPLVAVRALLTAGIIPSPRGWSSLPVETRVAIARHGLEGVVDVSAVRELAQQIPPRHLKLVSRSRDPNPDTVPSEVVRALGPARPLSDGEWRSLRAVDRAILVSLTANTRLLARAYDELAESMGKAPSARRVLWSGSLARCELHASPEALARVSSEDFLDGRALMLARVAGIRAARRISETFDLHADSAAGAVELIGTVQHRDGYVVWQAHVSTWDGAFFPAAAMLACTTAATALFDMIKQDDPHAWIEGATIREEAWNAGVEVVREEATQLYAPGGRDVVEPRQGSKEEIRKLIDEASGKWKKGLDRASDPLSTEGVDLGGATVRDLPSSSEPYSQAPEVVSSESVPKSESLPASSARSRAVPVSRRGDERRPTPYRASEEVVREPQETPRGLVALFVASIVILLVAVGIFAYVLVRMT
jgi:molybdenum cofactor biosynthesis enzyme